MRPFVLLSVVLSLMSATSAQVNVGGPSSAQNPAYPLKVRILTRNTSRNAYGIRMWGRADLYSPDPQGFEFESTCDEVLMVSHGDERYSARWKKQDKELEMLVSRVGTGKTNKCSVKADLQPFVYEIEGRTIVTKPLPPKASGQL